MSEFTNESDDCGICGLSIKDKYSYALVCNHTFHYECLMKSFQNTHKYKKEYNHCPYCRKNSDYLPLVNGLKKVVPNVHCHNNTSSIKEKKEDLKNNYSNRCEFILSRGKNKGNHCGKNCILGYGYCKTHLEKMKNKHGDIISDFSLPTSNDVQQNQQIQQIQHN